MLDQLSRIELMHLMELATGCLSVQTREELKDLISGLYRLVDYRKAVLCKLSPSDCAASVQELVNHSYGSEWADVYARERFERIDPVLRQGSAADGAFRWHEIASPSVDKSTEVFLDAARDFGVVDGFTFACGLGDDRSPRTLLSIAGVERSVPRRTLAILTTFGPHLHEAYRRVLDQREPKSSHVELTSRQVEVLSWKQQGKTHWEIGSILGISQRTVKYHFAQIEAKLGAVNASHAVAQALQLGLIK